MMNSKAPTISVLMTVFNAAPYLAASIESIAQQTFADWEFLIVDDASTDASRTIAESYAACDPRIRVISNAANKGQTACLNQGLSEAAGVWIARQDADDISLPTRLEKQIAHVTAKPELALIGTAGMMINEQGNLVGLLDVPLRHEVIVWSAPLMNPFLHTAVLFRADVVRFLGGYDSNYRIAQDYDLWSRMIAGGYATMNLPERLICYRHLKSSLSKANQEETLQEIAIISERTAEENFGNRVTSAERKLLQAWRFPEQHSNFWKLYHQLAKDFLEKNILIQKDQTRFTAALHLKIAGSCSSLKMLHELGAAFLADPDYVIRWVGERFCPSLFLKNS